MHHVPYIVVGFSLALGIMNSLDDLVQNRRIR